MIKHGKVKGQDKQVDTRVHHPSWPVKKAKQVITE
jgi:hypothetical protein